MQDQIVANNQLINFEIVSAEGNGPTIIFLHGWRSVGMVFKPLAMALADQLQARSFLLDLPGFGASPAPKTPFSVGDYAEVVLDFNNKLKLPNVILVGHSFGGRIGIKLSASCDKVDKLILIDTAGIPLAAKRKKFLMFLAKLVKPFFSRSLLQGLRKKIYTLLGAEDYVSTPELLETFRLVTSENLQPICKNIRVPTLIIWGENDKDTPLEQGKVYEKNIKNSKLVILNQAGHFSFVDRPAEVTAAIVSFLI